IMYLAICLKISFQKNIKNRLFQISSTDAVSEYEFVNLFASVFKEDSKLIERKVYKIPIKSSSGESMNYKPCYHLDSKNLEGYFKVTFPSVEESLNFTFKRFKGDESSKTFTKSDGVVFI
ncbi:hypothetical protein N9O57_02130, partial [bacterium]|nr:hypothetical protein [bacterium]